MPAKISKKQQEILDYLKDEILSKGYPPTVREICEKVGLKSTSSVHSHLSTLERNGFIRRDPTKPRAIEICDDSFQMVRTEMASLPVVGNVAAGQPILAQENIENYFPVPADILPPGESFALRVRGESMINAGILDGDLVFINYRTGEPNKNSSYDTHLYKLCDEAGIKHFCMHALRHTYATRAIERGVQPKVLQQLLGHASIQTTMDRYVHISDDSLLKAVHQFESGCA